VCTKCGQRRQDRFFNEGTNFCTTCERKQSASQPIHTSVQNTFIEQDLQSDPNAQDIGLVIRSMESDISENLEHRLVEQGYVKL
jgi:hypothetical protein